MTKKIYSLLACIFVLTATHAQTMELCLNLKEGREYQQNSESSMTIVQDLGEQTMEIFMIVKGKMTYKVTGVGEKEYEMNVKYESVSLSMEMPQGKVEFSSEQPGEDDIFSQILSEMVGKPFQVSMTRTGRVKEVKNIDKMIESIFKNFKGLSAAEVKQFKAQLMKAYGEKAFRGSIEMVTAIYPDKPVSIGESWIVKTKLESGMLVDLKTNYTLEANEADHNLIRGVSEIETLDKDSYIEVDGVAVRYDLKGEMHSEIKVNKSTGWIVEAKISQHISGSASLKDSPQFPGGMDIPMSIDSKIAYGDD